MIRNLKLKLILSLFIFFIFECSALFYKFCQRLKNCRSLFSCSCVVQEVIESKVMEDDRSADGEGGLVTVSGLYTQNPLQRSVSQLIDKNDEESWEPHFRRLDSGLVRASLTSAGQMLFLLK